MENLAHPLDLYELIPGPVGPGTHVGLDTGVGGKKLQGLPDLELLELLRGLYNWKRALKPLAIENARGQDVVHIFNPPRLK